MPNTKRKAVILHNPEAPDDEDFLTCMQYIQWVEHDLKTKASFADEKGIDRSTIYQWIIKWTENGLLRSARQYFWSIIGDDVIVANRKAAAQWPALLEKQIDLAFHAKSDFVKFQAIGWIYDRIVQPLQNEQDEPGSDERDFLTLIAASPRALEPLSVSGVDAADDPEPEVPESTA